MLKKFFTYQLSVKFYRQCEKMILPRHLKDQLLRASSSIVLNLAEGSGKTTPKDKKKFYNISLGSLRECQAILELSGNATQEMVKLADFMGACLYKLCYK